MNEIVILIGSNINPQLNIKASLYYLSEHVEIVAFSQIWKTKAFGSDGPDFLNLAVQIQTSLDYVELKNELLSKIENRLGRVRTSDKNAPRTIDLDPIIMNDIIIDGGIWEKVFIAVPAAEIKPDLIEPKSGNKLKIIASKLKSSGFSELFPVPKDFLPN